MIMVAKRLMFRPFVPPLFMISDILMRKRIVLLTILIPLLMSCGTDRLEVYDLRCENLSNPLGLATSCPRFSWNFNAPAGVAQTALEIQVASSEAALKRGQAVLWLSGRVESDAQILVLRILYHRIPK